MFGIYDLIVDTQAKVVLEGQFFLLMKMNISSNCKMNKKLNYVSHFFPLNNLFTLKDTSVKLVLNHLDNDQLQSVMWLRTCFFFLNTLIMSINVDGFTNPPKIYNEETFSEMCLNKHLLEVKKKGINGLCMTKNVMIFHIFMLHHGTKLLNNNHALSLHYFI